MEEKVLYTPPVSDVVIPNIGTGDISGIGLPDDSDGDWENH